jgi:hypothetical protein
MAAIKAKLCFFPVSEWVHALILTCDDQLAVWFKKGVKHYTVKGKRHGYGGVPGICCLYPNTTRRFFDLAIVFPPGPGEFVHRFLYKKMAYKPVQPPAFPCAGCATTVIVQSDNNPSTSGQNVTFTATVSDSDGTSTPTGTVDFLDGSNPICTAVALVNGQATCSTSGLSVGTHTITASYHPAAGFQSASGSMTQTVNSSGVNACGCTGLPTTLHASVTNQSNCPNAGATIPLTYDAGTGKWTGAGAAGTGMATLNLTFYCNAGGVSCADFRLDDSWTGCVAGSSTGRPPDAGCSCSPLSVVFSGIPTGSGSLCGCGGSSAPATVRVTITT